MSFIIPGTGQFYNKEYGKGVAFLGAWAAGVGILGYEMANLNIFSDEPATRLVYLTPFLIFGSM